MEIDELEIRRATQDDKTAILDINDNIYDGMDYLPAYFDNLMTSPNVKAYVVEVEGKVVAFSIAFIVDDGRTVISRAGRVSEKYSGRKIYSCLQRYLLQQSEATENSFTTANANPAVNTMSFQRDNILISTRSLIRFDFQSNNVKLNTFKDEHATTELSQVSQKDLQRYMTSTDIAAYLFPDDVIIIDWVPYRLLSSNIPLLGLSGTAFNLTARASPVHHVIELLIVADYSSFKSWYDKTPSTDSHLQRVTQATSNLKAYLGSLYRSSNIAYNSLEPYNIFIQIKLVDILVMTTAADSPWTETIRVRGSPKYRVDPTAALPLFKKKSIELQSTIPHDHAMLFTLYSLWQGSGGTFSGYAYTDAECLQKSLSIVEDNQDFYTAQLMAHEIGHSLGCQHDGDGNSCPTYQGYTMEASFILANKNKWTFSTCSVDYIRGYLNTLNQGHNNCLKTSQNSHPNPQMAQLMNVWYGQLYTVDEQCILHFGKGSYLCRDLYYRDYSTVCLKLKCYDPSKRSCYYIDGGDGTSCGDGKWCMSDECVTDNRAPSVSDLCPHGDQPGIVKNGMTCKQLVNHDRSLCRNNDVKYPCCDACNPSSSSSHTTKQPVQHTSHTSTAATTSNGGHQTSTGSIDDQCAQRHGTGSYLCRGATRYDGKSYADVVCWDLQCHDTGRNNWCLSSPADDKTPCGDGKWCINRRCVADSRAPSLSDVCPYGDQPSGTVAYGLTCADIKHPQYHFHCYDDYISRVCCETCQSIQRNISGCPYGDKSDWCHTNIASQRDKQTCYWGHNEDLCCESCARYKNNAHTGCEFGDKSNTCRSLSCSTYSSSQQGRCCETCLSPVFVG